MHIKLYEYVPLSVQLLLWASSRVMPWLTIDPTLTSFHVFKVRLVFGRACLVLRACRSAAFLDHDLGSWTWTSGVSSTWLRRVIKLPAWGFPLSSTCCRVAVIVCMNKLRGDAGSCGNITTLTLGRIRGFPLLMNVLQDNRSLGLKTTVNVVMTG
jgi:hypothetical protein